ncbi:MAG: insulinase family protein [Rhodospirillaceae bacterium]|nr:MAG: insulinase family protein [Rhodospirillaceae bacterium]
MLDRRSSVVPRRIARQLVLFCLLSVCCLIFAPAARAIEIQQVTGDSGVTAWLVEDHSNPLIAVALGFMGGSADDPAGKEGLAELTSGLLDEGAGEFDSASFQKQLNDNGIDYGFDASRDSFTGQMNMLTEQRDLAFGLLHRSLTTPHFDAEPVERIRRQLLAMIDDRLSDPDVIGARAVSQTLFGGHPYGRPGIGTAESMQAITADDLHRFVARHFTRDRLHLVAVGDITAAQLQPLLDSTFGDLPASSDLPAVPEARLDQPGGVMVVDRGIPQSIINFAQPGIKRDDPDFFAAYVANYILGGGGFSSRLMHEVREKRGLAYGISTSLVTFDHAGLIWGQVQTVNERVAKTIEIIRAEWAKMRDRGPTAAEVDTAKTYLLGSYPRLFTSGGGTAGALLGIQLEGLGIDYIDRRQAEIAKVTPASVARVAKRLLQPDRLVFAVVGQPVGVTATLSTPASVAGDQVPAQQGASGPEPKPTHIQQ